LDEVMRVTSASFTFVALDQAGKPRPIPPPRELPPG
jgi:acyl-CoA hydrolase